MTASPTGTLLKSEVPESKILGPDVFTLLSHDAGLRASEDVILRLRRYYRVRSTRHALTASILRL
jgi:hypothetical protein